MPCLERLEDRQLLAIVSAVDAQGALSVISDAADPIALGTNSLGNVTVNGADPGTGAFPSATVTGVTIQGGPGANLIDFSAFQITNFPALTTLTVDGGGGNDELVAPDASRISTSPGRMWVSSAGPHSARSPSAPSRQSPT